MAPTEVPGCHQRGVTEAGGRGAGRPRPTERGSVIGEAGEKVTLIDWLCRLCAPMQAGRAGRRAQSLREPQAHGEGCKYVELGMALALCGVFPIELVSSCV